MNAIKGFAKKTGEFFLLINSKNIIGVYKSPDDKEWHERLIKGDLYGIGKTYMGYLKKKDVIEWLERDYDDVKSITFSKAYDLKCER